MVLPVTAIPDLEGFVQALAGFGVFPPRLDADSIAEAHTCLIDTLCARGRAFIEETRCEPVARAGLLEREGAKHLPDSRLIKRAKHKPRRPDDPETDEIEGDPWCDEPQHDWSQPVMETDIDYLDEQ
jgi:hypothetical protein